MNGTPDQSNKDRAQYVFNLTLAAVAGQVGFLTLFIILAALFGGLWLDKMFATRPLFTVVLMLASIPVTLVMMFWVVRKATSKIKPIEKQTPEEESNRGTN